MEINEQTVSSGDSLLEETYKEVVEELNEDVKEDEIITEDGEASPGEESVEDEELNTEVAEDVNSDDSNDFYLDYLVQLQEEQGVMLEQLNETVETGQQTIWSKPIEEYTPTEGYLCLIFFLILGCVIFKIVGGIICIR